MLYRLRCGQLDSMVDLGNLGSCAEALRLSPSRLHLAPLSSAARFRSHVRFTSDSADRSPVEKTSAASCDGGSKLRARSVELAPRNGGEQCEPPAEEQAE